MILYQADERRMKVHSVRLVEALGGFVYFCSEWEGKNNPGQLLPHNPLAALLIRYTTVKARL